jgi:hypothetical protein
MTETRPTVEFQFTSVMVFFKQSLRRLWRRRDKSEVVLRDVIMLTSGLNSERLGSALCFGARDVKFRVVQFDS